MLGHDLDRTPEPAPLPDPSALAPSNAQRFDEVDAIKALGILVVVAIHTVRSPWEVGASDVELWLGHVTRFAVPSFLFASGFLYSTRASVPFEATRRRLVRIALPYLLFSIAAQAVRHVRGLGPATGSVLGDLASANSFGPYYYVLVFAAMVLAVPLLARLSPRAHFALFAAALAFQGWLEVYSRLPFTWHLRNPLLWLPYFQLGWIARSRSASIARIPRARAAAIALACASAAAGAFGALWTLPPHSLARAIEWLAIYACIAALFFAARAVHLPAGAHAAVRGLSDVTYSVYLSHLLFLPWLRDAFRAAPGVLEPAAIALPWLAALAGSLAIVAVARALLGVRSRAWIGA